MELALQEYKDLRKEIRLRVGVLYALLLLAVMLWAAFVLIGYGIFLKFGSKELISFSLLTPIIFSWLSFVYQDNQKTLERVAKYIEEELKPKLDNSIGWEQWFAQQKSFTKISSSYKVFSLLAPYVGAVYLLVGRSLTAGQTNLALLDIFLGVIVLLNFRYKLYRVK